MPDVKYDKMAVDFGTSNTVVAFWNEAKKEVDLHHIPDVTRPFHFQENGTRYEIPYIPSYIYYHDLQKNFIGYQVIEKSLEKSQGTFRWMKAYVSSRRRIKYPLPDGSQLDYFQASRDFLEKVILFAQGSGHIDLSTCELAFTVPVESFEHYTDWLSGVCREIGIRRYRFIDESSACIFGYETHLQSNNIFLIFDFGGGTLDVSIVKIEESVDGGKGCKVLGKAGCNLGGRTIDGWIYKDLLDQAKLHDIDTRPASALFMLKVQEIKERLTMDRSWEYDVTHQASGLSLKGRYHRSDLEDLLDHNNLYSDVQTTIDRALNAALEKGITKKDIKEALLVGGTSQIPSIRRQVKTIFGERTRSYRPYDAVARGACKYLTSDVEALYDHIQHDYAIKSYDSRSGTHKFIPLVPKGTSYPTKADFKKLTLKAVRDEQRFFGIDIYEVAQKGSRSEGIGELVFDLNGNMVFDNNQKNLEEGTEFWMNEEKPTFIEANPPAVRSDPRFSATFRIDSQKRFLITVRDIKTQKLLYRDHPVVKLK